MAGLGDLVIKLHADMTAFTSDMGRAAHISEREWRKISRSAADAARVITTGAAIAGATVVKLGSDSLKFADDLYKMSQKVGVSVESLSGLQYAAKLSDVSVESLGTGLRQLAKNMQDTAANTGDARLAFAAMGMSVTTVGGGLKTTEAQLLEIADRFAGMEDGAGKTALAMKIFGRAGADLIPLLNQGAAGLKTNAEEARKFGLVISTEAAKKAEAFNDELTKIKESLRGFSLGLTMEALPNLARFIEQLNAAAKAAGGAAAGLKLWLTTHVPDDVGGALQENSAKIARLRTLRDELTRPTFANSLNDTIFGDVASLDRQIKFAEAQRGLLLAAQRQQALAAPGSDTPGERARMAGRGKAAAPLLPDEAAIRNAQKRVEDGTKLLNEVFAQQAKEIYAVDHATEDLVVTYDGLGNKLEVTVAQFQKMQSAMEGAGQIIRDSLNAPLVEAAEMAQEASDNLVYTWDAAGNRITITRQKYEELNSEQDKAAEAAKRFGFIFNSALEDAIINGGKLSAVLKSLAQDLSRMVLRQGITEPLGTEISKAMAPIGKEFGKWFAGLFKADGGPVSGGQPYIVGERGPELFVPGASGSIVPNGGFGGQAVTVNLNVQSLDPRTASHAILQNMPLIAETLRRAAAKRGNGTGF